MEMLELRLRLSVGELLDAGEDIEFLLYRESDSDVSPTFHDLLFTLDEILTEAYRNHAVARASVTVDDAAPPR